MAASDAMTALEELVALGTKPGATEDELAVVEATLGPIPPGYRALLRRVNGLEGSLGESYLVLWEAKDILQQTVDWRALVESNEEPFPTDFMIGSDGGGEVFGLAMVGGEEEYVMFPWLGSHPDDTIVLGRGVEAFAERLWRGVFSRMETSD